MFMTRFVQLLQERGVSSYKITKDTGIPNGLISDWKLGKKTPAADNLIKLANYFDVSVDYLLGRTDNPEKAAGVITDEQFSKSAIGYMSKESIQKFVEAKSPRERVQILAEELANERVSEIDIDAGSGGFLIVAARYLEQHANSDAVSKSEKEK